MTAAIFTEEEQALFKRSPKKIRRFINIFWPNNEPSFDSWMRVRIAVHGAQLYADGKNSALLREWYELAVKRVGEFINDGLPEQS